MNQENTGLDEIVLEKFAAGCPVLFTKKGWVREGQSGVELDDPRVGLIALLHFFDGVN